VYNLRQQRIIEQVTDTGEVRVAELKERYEVTEMTIRRDLEKLEHHGVIRRTFGGAILTYADLALSERASLYMEEKRAIGKKAASLVQAGESIYIDGGTTTLQIAKHVAVDPSITIVTNALNIATELIDKHIPTMIIGGMVVEATSSAVGPLAIEAMSKMAFDRIFLGTTGVSILQGFSNSNMYEADLKRLAIRRATEVNIVTDHTKFGVKSLVSFADFMQVDRIISSQWPDEELQQACLEAHVEIIVVT
jgi:DeoR family fructose operon transcriptional repressor